MTSSTSHLRHFLRALLLLLVLSVVLIRPATAACTTTGACLSAGPRLLRVDSTQSVLLNSLLGGLLGISLSLTAVG